VVVGELGLAADVRPVPGLGRRLAEAARLGFDHAIVPIAGGRLDAAAPGASAPTAPPAGMKVSPVGDLGGALRSLGDDSGVVRWLRDRQA
jgi:DNA repair protein RadA/Sms